MMDEEPSETVVRAARRADVQRLGVLGAQLVQAHHDFDPRRFIAPGKRTPDHYGAFLGSQLDEPHAVLLVAEHEGQVIGYAYAVLEEGYDYMLLRGPAAILHDLIVDPAYRGRGAGRLLVDAILSAMVSHGAPRVVLSSAERNEAAQRLFEKMGFRRTMVEMTRELDDQPPTPDGARQA
jgi:ribosomal protein S18 acetylase RimI-like enzyme